MENDKFVLYLDVMNVLNLFEEDRGIRRFKFSDQGVCLKSMDLTVKVDISSLV